MARGDKCSTSSSRTSSIYSLLPCEMAFQMSNAVRRRIRSPMSWAAPRLRSYSTSSTTSDESTSATLVNTGINTPQESQHGAQAEQLAMTALTARMNAWAASPSDTLFRQDEAASINWRAVAVGINLFQAALDGRESMTPAAGRTMLIDGLKYMVVALPDDLSEREICLLNEFLPASSRPATGADTLGQRALSMDADAESENLLRSSTARLVCFLISLFLLVLPIFASLLNRALEYERQYHLTERAIQGTGQLARTAGSASLSAGDSLIRFGQTPVGGQCLYSARWIFQSIIEGVGDGLDRTMKQQTTRLSSNRFTALS